jgi:hypothetical protein
VVTERSRADGGEEGAIALLPDIFSDGVFEKALTRKMTREEACKHSGGASTQVYRTLLRHDEDRRVQCRLCAVGANGGGWKIARDVLRHLKRDHFGLGKHCSGWLVPFHTNFITRSCLLRGPLVVRLRTPMVNGPDTAPASVRSPLDLRWKVLDSSEEVRLGHVAGCSWWIGLTLVRLLGSSRFQRRYYLYKICSMTYLHLDAL